jgi:hypothetical protein
MARCPFAEWMEISGASGSYTGGGHFKIVHHTTEGGSAQGAFAAFRANRSDPHFTVDGSKIYQHIDTGEAARALRNAPGGVQTNRDSAIQIEVVGFAHRPKAMATLKNVQKLCNWLEETHGIPKVWPNGPPKAAVNGHDPGGHNRNAANWDQKGGHYGHSEVPENTHWDPGYTAAEAAFVIADAASEAISMEELKAIPLEDAADFDAEISTMPDHAVPQGAEEVVESVGDGATRRPRARKRATKRAAAAKPPATKKAAASKTVRGTRKTADRSEQVRRHRRHQDREGGGQKNSKENPQESSKEGHQEGSQQVACEGVEGTFEADRRQVRQGVVIAQNRRQSQDRRQTQGALAAERSTSLRTRI